MGVNVAAQFKKDERGMNGLLSIVESLLKEPRETRYLIAEYEVVRVMEDLEDGGTRTPTIKLVHIEPMVADDDEEEAHRILQNAYVARQKNEAAMAPAKPRDEDQPDLFAEADDDSPATPPAAAAEEAPPLDEATPAAPRKPGSRAARKHLFSNEDPK